MVKLIQFRDTGKFHSKISNKGNKNILLKPHADGCFDISIIAPLAISAKDAFLEASLSEMISYLLERIIGKSSNSEISEAIRANVTLTDVLGKQTEYSNEQISKAMDIIENQQIENSKLNREIIDYYKERASEKERENEILKNKLIGEKVNEIFEKKLISMATPLLKEIAVPLRSSAENFQIISGTGKSQRSLLYLNRKMASKIENETTDENISLLLCDIVQYNKESGWGKVRALNRDELISFSIPRDIKERIQGNIIRDMRKDKVYAQAYIVRDKAKQPYRLIIVGILETPTS